jgi:hypothetical protein
MSSIQSEHWLKSHIERVLFGLGLVLIVFTIIPSALVMVTREGAFSDWAYDHAPQWLVTPFCYGGLTWEEALAEAVARYCFLPSILIVVPCLLIAMLFLYYRACSWGKAQFGVRVYVFFGLFGLLWLVTLLWMVPFLARGRT